MRASILPKERRRHPRRHACAAAAAANPGTRPVSSWTAAAGRTAPGTPRRSRCGSGGRRPAERITACGSCSRERVAALRRWPPAAPRIRIVRCAERSLSITTTLSASPATSTPSRKLAAPQQHPLPEARKRSSNSERAPPPCTNSGHGPPRSSSAASRSARCEANSTNARPPEASSTGRSAATWLRCIRARSARAGRAQVAQRLALPVEWPGASSVVGSCRPSWSRSARSGRRRRAWRR